MGKIIYTDSDTITSIRLALNLIYIGISVEGFVSYEEQLERIKLINLPVSKVGEVLDKLAHKRDTVNCSRESIEAGRHYEEEASRINIVIPGDGREKEKEVYSRISEARIEGNFVFTSRWGDRWFNCPFTPTSVYRMIVASQKRRLIIYVTEHLAWELLELLQAIGVVVEYVVCDEETSASTKIKVKNIYDIMDENYYEIKVLIPDNKDAYRKLDEMGLKEGVEYSDYIHMYNFRNIDMGYDPLLGYNFSIYNEEENLPGFVCYGNRNAENKM